MKQKDVFIFIGPSASGKTTTENKIMEIRQSFSRLVSSTSRDIRDGEIDGTDYYFKSPEGCLASDNAVEIHIKEDWVYSLSKSEVENKLSSYDSLIYSCINTSPAKALKKHLESIDGVRAHIIFFDIDENQRIELLRKRGDMDDEIKERLSREENLYESGIVPNLVIRDIYSSVTFFSDYLLSLKS